MYRRYIKHILDIMLSVMMLIVFIIPMIIISIIIKADNKGPVLFKQKRVGIHKRYFYILKFRTMRTDTPHDIPTHKLSSPDAYITRAGKILRKTSLDELPQLFNIIKGDMSFVGPRPALWNQYDLIEERDKYGANDILPGLTGWAQINGRDKLEIVDKAKLDGVYVRKQNFIFDLKCLCGTVINVIKHDGVVEGKAETENDKED